MTDGGSVQRLLRERVAEEVRALLARKMMTGADLALAIGRSPMYVSRRIRGEVAFDLDDMERLAAVLDVEVADLLPRPVSSSRGAGAVGDRGTQTIVPVNSSLQPMATQLTAPRPPARPSRHVVVGGGPHSPSRRDATRPVSAIPASRRRPTPMGPGVRPMSK